MTLTDVDSLAGVTCRITALDDSRDVQDAALTWEDGNAVAVATAKAPGLYRVAVRTLDGADITQLVLAGDAGGRLEEAQD